MTTDSPAHPPSQGKGLPWLFCPPPGKPHTSRHYYFPKFIAIGSYLASSSSASPPPLDRKLQGSEHLLHVFSPRCSPHGRISSESTPTPPAHPVRGFNQHPKAGRLGTQEQMRRRVLGKPGRGTESRKGDRGQRRGGRQGKKGGQTKEGAQAEDGGGCGADEGLLNPTLPSQAPQPRSPLPSHRSCRPPSPSRLTELLQGLGTY